MSTAEDHTQLVPGKVNYDQCPHFVNKKGQRLFCKYWNSQESAVEPRAIVLIAHGVGEHCVYYEPIAKLLLPHDILVAAHDHVGHGLSEGSRVHIDDCADYVHDLVQHCDIVKKSHPNCPVFLIGHSMGGTIVLKAALDHPEMFRGIVLIGPAIVPNPATATPFKTFMAKAIAKVIPQCPVSPIESQWISRDPVIRNKYDADPLVHHGSLKARWAVSMMHTLTELQSRLGDTRFPFLVLHGAEDKLCEISGSKMLHQLSPSEDKTIKIYPGAYHQVHNEIEGVGEQSMAEIVDWIVKRM